MAFVQSKSAFNDFATSVAAAFTSNNAAGNLLIAVVGNDSSVTPTIADSRPNTWQTLAVSIDNAGVMTTIFYAMNCAAGSNTVTASFGATSVASSICIEEWSGAATASALDKTATGTGFGTAATTSNTATTTQADEVLVVGTCREAVNSPFTFTPGTNYTEREDTGAVSAVRPAQLEDRVVAATAAYAGAATLGGSGENWAEAIATFKLSGGSGPTAAQEIPIFDQQLSGAMVGTLWT